MASMLIALTVLIALMVLTVRSCYRPNGNSARWR